MPIFKTKIFNRGNNIIASESKNMSVHEQVDSENRTFLSKSETQLFKDRGYSFARQIGEGSYAKVFHAYLVDGKMGGRLACKVINSKLAPREYSVKFLPREIDILEKIGHPNIVHVYSIYRLKSTFFIFMRFAELGDLLDFVVAHGELSEKLSKFWFHQLACAIYYLHSLNIAHRDIKCENILISNNYNVKLADFGFARYVADINGKLLLSSTYCGSLAYASPEILRGKSYYPKGSDIWSLGIVLYIMLNKCMPFHDANVKILYKQQLAKKWKFRSKAEKYVSAEGINLVKDLLEPDFRKRIQASDIVNNIWFTNEGFVLNEECQNALEYASKFKNEMVSKKQLKLKSWDKEEFVVLCPEKDPMETDSVLQIDTTQITISSVQNNIPEIVPLTEEKSTLIKISSNIIITNEQEE